MHDDTRFVHAGREHLARQGVHVPTVDLSTTYPIEDLNDAAESLGRFAEGAVDASNSIYGRLHNSTVVGLERATAALESAEESVAFGSGMAAVTACLLAAKMNGAGHVVGVRPVYGGTDHLLSSGLAGLDVTWCAVEEIPDAIRPDTGLIILETPANPTLALIDIQAVRRVAGTLPILVDSTFATPVLQRPLECGATLVLHSATKFLGGHGDAMGGLVACDNAWARRLRQVRVATGALMHPWGAFLIHRGLQTLGLRVERAQDNARKLVRALATHRAVERVFYPELDPAYAALTGQMSGPGAVLAFEVAGGRSAAAQVMAEVCLITPAVSLGSVDSLIQHPAGLTHQIAGEKARADGGVSEALLRVSVGIENANDLWSDLANALDRSAYDQAEKAYSKVS